MKIRFTSEGRTITATLADSRTARDFVQQLPLTVTLNDHAATEKIVVLPRRLSTDGAPAGSDPSASDLAYYAPWGNLAIFYRDFPYASGLIVFGKLDGDAAMFSTPGPMKVVIERLD